MFSVGLVGCGFMGRMHANVYSALEGARLTHVHDREPTRAADYASQFGLEIASSFAEILANPNIDIVDICLPTYLHREYAVAALEAGKHVFCEKPIALTVADANAMIAASVSTGKRLMIGHCIRFWPEYVMLKGAVDDGRYGKLLSLNLTRFGEFPSWSIAGWLGDESLSGGGVLDMHIHDTDFALHLLGEPTKMVSFGTVDDRGPSYVFTTMDYGDAVIHTEGGWNLPTNTPFKMAFRAIFERGAMIMDGGPLTVYRPSEAPFTPEFPKMKAQGGGNISDLGGYYHELRYFIDCLSSGAPLTQVTPESALLSLDYTLREIAQMRSRA